MFSLKDEKYKRIINSKIALIILKGTADITKRVVKELNVIIEEAIDKFIQNRENSEHGTKRK